MTSFSENSWDPQRLAALSIVRAWECGSKTIWRVWHHHRHALDAFLQHREQWKHLGLTETQQHAISVAMIRVQDAAEELDREHIRFLLPWDADYPPSLAPIPDPPAALFIRGTFQPDALRIAIVGTRKATSYGRRCASQIARELGEAGATIVSGLAFGIDAAAHLGAIESGAPTIAVLPCGASDRAIVPHAHVKLAQKILEHRGAIISEHAPGTPALAYQYLHRNRMISGLARATVIVEADVTSGALTTAKLALEQGGDVLAVPGSIYSPVSRGTHNLLRDGAKPCTGAGDILELRGIGGAERIASVNSAREHLPMSDTERTALHVLTEPMEIDDIIRISGCPAPEMAAALTTLELKGYVMRLGKEYEKVD